MAEGSRTVLVIDDSRFYRTLLAQALGEAGLNCLTAASGREGLAEMARAGGAVDLVLLDLVMPEGNGFETLEALRARPDWAALPVVALSGYNVNGLEREILRQQGVCAFLAKSVPIERVLFEVRAALYPDSADRRRMPRLQAQLAVTVRHPKGTVLATSSDLSTTGMFLAHAEEDSPAAGSQVELRFWVPGASDVFGVRGRVAWVNGAGATFDRQHPPGFGVDLVEPDPAVVEALRGFLAHQA